MRALRTSFLMASPLFYSDVLPVLEKHCLRCHATGQIAPMSFETFEQARPYAKAIREAAVRRTMPPWFSSDPAGHFANDPRLNPSEIDTLKRWASGGAKKGQPRPARFESGSLAPGAVFSPPAPIRVPAAGPIDYQHIIVPTGFQTDRWVTAIDVRPGDRRVVHHAVVFVRPPASRWLREYPAGAAFMAKSPKGLSAFDEVIGTYLPGAGPQRLPDGHAKLIPAGSDLIFQIHYTPNGTAVEDLPRIEFEFAKTKPVYRIYGLSIAQPDFEIPPGAPRHSVRAEFIVHTRAAIYSLAPHMHLRGAAMEVSAGGRTILRMPKYNFNWQLTYRPRKPVELARGEAIEFEAVFDNSPNNARNPDASKTVRWGEQSDEEMAVCFVDLILPATASPNEVFRRLAIDR